MKFNLLIFLLFLHSTTSKLEFQDDLTPKKILDFIEKNLPKNLPSEITAYSVSNSYNHTILPPLLPYLFENLEIIENIAPITNINRPGIKKPKYLICVHDTGSFRYGAEGWSKALYYGHYPDGYPYEVSYQYVIGNDGIWHNIPDDEIAYHAGDGTTFDYKEYNTSLIVNENEKGKKINVTINNNGFYVINGRDTKIKSPTFNNKILKNEDINNMGIRVKVRDNYYYIGDTWYSETYKKISNRGGNLNSIGIESCLDENTDIFWTWMKMAKLVAYLMDEHNFDIEDVVGHHFFSGKECPKTILRNKMWDYFKYVMVVNEYEILQFKKKGFVIVFDCDNKEFIGKNGKVIKLPENDLEVKFSVVVSKDGVSEKREFKTVIKGKKKKL